MSANVLEITKQITKKHPNWKMLCKKLRVNDKIVEDGNFSPKPSPYIYKNLELIERFETKIIWTEITAVGRECSIELQNRAEFDIEGNFICGTMNTFYAGFDEMDEIAIKGLFSEAKDQFSKITYWDIISNTIDDSILQGFNIPVNDEDKGVTSFDGNDKNEILINLFKSYKNKDFSLCRQLVSQYFDGLNPVDVKALVDEVPNDIKHQTGIFWMKLLDEIGLNLKVVNPIISYFAMLNYNFAKTLDKTTLNINLSKEIQKKLSNLICPICNKKISICKCLSS